jgi:hypothetical protein
MQPPFEKNSFDFSLTKDDFTKFDWTWPAASGEADLKKKRSVYFHSFAIISFWRRGCPSFEQFWIPFI